MPTTVYDTISLPSHIPKVFDHQPLNRRQLGDSPRGSSFRGDPLGEPPFNPLVEPFGWLAPNSHMFIPPWY
jgi:hypothetical protein